MNLSFLVNLTLIDTISAVVKPKSLGRDGPTMGNADGLFGMTAFDKTYDVCDILEIIAPNVSELQLFRDDVEQDLCMCCESLRLSSRFHFFSPSCGFNLRHPI